MLRRLAALALLPLAAGCSVLQEHGATAAGTIGGVRTASQMSLLTPEYLAGALIAYAIYDPLAPNWSIRAIPLDDERVRFEMRMKALASGGDGEARPIFLRSARQMVEAEGFSGFDVIGYEEGIESARPFARRVASGEIRMVRSRALPGL